MASIKVEHTIGDLESDLRKITTKTKAQMSGVVRRNVLAGRTMMRQIAREASGPHGYFYWKRITSDMITPLEGEFGPHGVVVGNAVGAGWRHGVNTDIPKTADLIGPKFADDVADAADSLFWPS